MQTNIVDLNQAAQNFVLAGDSEGVERCFQYSLHPLILIDWMQKTNSYSCLGTVLHCLQIPEESFEECLLVKILTKIYVQALHEGNEEIVALTETYTTRSHASFYCGKFGYTSNILPTKLFTYREYTLGLVAGNQVELFAQVYQPELGLDLQEVAKNAGRRVKVDFMQHLGYEQTLLAAYVQGLLEARKKNYREVVQELMQKGDVCAVLNERLHSILTIAWKPDLEECLWLMRQGATLSAAEQAKLKQKQPDVYRALFEADV